MRILALVVSLACAPLAVSSTHGKRAATPYVDLGHSKFIGYTYGGIDTFRGIPYAKPPVGNLRLRPPQPINSQLGLLYATGIPRACPQSRASITINPAVQSVLSDLRAEYANSTGNNGTSSNSTIPPTNDRSIIYTEGEDCLTLSE
jgi:hypothetical protein